MATRARTSRQSEAKHDYIVLKKFKTINTQPSRTALEEQDFAWLENLMPIGDAYAPAVPAPDTATATLSGTITRMRQVTIDTTDYMFCFTAAGGAQAVNMANGAITTVAPTATFTTATPGPAVDQWKSERAVICDPSAGYFSWDGATLYSPGSVGTVSVTVGGTGYTGTPTVTFTGGGGSGATAVAVLADSSVLEVTLVGAGSGYTAAPAVGFTGGGGSGTTATAYIMPSGQVGSAIATYSGRVWIANARTLTYTAPGTWLDFNAANASGSTTISEGFLRQQIEGLEALDNYLYVFGDSSIFIIGDLKVTGSITTYSFTNLSSTTGSTLPDTITSLERAILFMNKYGIYATYGASVQKVSQQLDGVFPFIDFTKPISAGLATIYNILCYVVSFTYDDPNQSSARTIQAAYFGGKWFLTNQGTINFIAPAQIDGQHFCYGADGSSGLRKLYQDTTASVSTTMKTALMPLSEGPIFDKQVLRAGIEYTAPAETVINIRIDSERDSDRSISYATNAVKWLNNDGVVVPWINNTGEEVDWLTSGFVLYQFFTDLVGKYVGFTLTSDSPQIIINGMLAEYAPRASW